MQKIIINIALSILFSGFVSIAVGQDKEEKEAIKAIKGGDIESLQSYMQLHGDANCLFSNGKSGLYYAITNEQDSISEYLIRHGADPNFVVDDNTMLYYAIKYNQARTVRFLIEYGAEVDKTDEKLNTPLMYAAIFNNKEMCKILVERGADPLHKNLKGRKASDYAIEHGQSPAYLYLVSMENFYREHDTVPSMHDGPHISWENDRRIVMTYYQHDHDKNFTSLTERTFDIGKADTVVEGFGWDHRSYLIKHSYQPDSTMITTEGDIFVVGDIHGKYKALLRLLTNNGIIDQDLKWNFGKGHLVLLGDVFDRGSLVTETLWFLYELEFQARAAGGNVDLLLGNHEVMAMTGDERYLNDKYRFFTAFVQTYYYRWYEKNTVIGKWLRSKNVIMTINGYLLSHAGISPQFAVLNYPFSEINSRIHTYLYSNYIIEKRSPEDFILGAYGPQWYRGYMALNEKFPAVTQDYVDTYLDSKGLKKMIVGHNEQDSIRSSYEGKVISADVEVDENGETSQGLLISGDELFRCKADGTREEFN